MFKIEKGIPIPKRPGWAKIVRQMKVGDSVLVENESRAASLRAALNLAGYGSTSAKVRGGFRVWRTDSKRKYEVETNE